MARVFAVRVWFESRDGGKISRARGARNPASTHTREARRPYSASRDAAPQVTVVPAVGALRVSVRLLGVVLSAARSLVEAYGIMTASADM